MARFRVGIAATGKGNNNLVVIAIRFRKLNIPRRFYRVICRTIISRQLNLCVIGNLCAIGRVDRKVAKRPRHAIRIKINRALVVCLIDWHAICGKIEIQSIRPHTVRIVAIVKAEGYFNVGNGCVIRQIQIHTRGQRLIGPTGIVVKPNGIVDQLAILILVKAGEIDCPDISFAGDISSLSYNLFAIRIKLNIYAIRSLAILIATIIPVNRAFQGLLIYSMSKVNVDGLRIDRRGALWRIADRVAVRHINNNRVDDRCAGGTVVVVVAINVLPGLRPVIICVQLKRLPGGFAVRIQSSSYAVRPQVVIVAIIVPVDMTSNIAHRRRIVQMDRVTFHRTGIATLFKLLTEILVDINKIGNFLAIFVQRQALYRVCPRIIPPSCYRVGLDKCLFAADLLVQIHLNAARSLTVAVLVIMPAGIQIDRTLIRSMG